MNRPVDGVGKRLRALQFGMLALGAVVIARSFSIQILTDSRLERMARRQFQGKMLLSPRRGAIVDRNGEALAVSVDSSSLAANPSKIRRRSNIVRLLARALDIPVEKLQARLREKREFIWLRRHLTEQEMNLLKKSQIIAADGDLVEGLWLVRESRRVHPHHELASHILGTTNIDNEGLEGVELWFNSALKGRVVSVDTTRDALGRPTFLDASVASSVRDGESVRLTIDASLQYSVQQELSHAVEKTGSKGGSVIVMNAVNGEILAMANAPGYDPGVPGSPVGNRRNRALTDGYEPGSTLKPVLLASALSGGMKLTDQIWGNQGSFVVQGKRISEAEAHEKFEWVSLKKMIQVSSNVVSAKLALKVGADRYLKTLQQLGFGAKSGMGFPGEISGRVPARKSWTPLTLANIGFGQGVLVTPLQMARAYAAFVNGGWLVDPVLVTGEHAPARQEPRRVFPASVADGVTAALSAVTEEGGTGGKAVLDGYRVAGKTGTAQTVDPVTRRYSRSHFIASFIGFATGVEPKMVIYASLDGPRGIYYASETAAPLFRNVLSAVVNRFSMPSDPRLVRNSTPEPKEVTADTEAPVPVEIRQAHPERPIVQRPMEEAAATAIEDGAEPWKMPSLIGLTAREALRALQGRSQEVQIEGRGVVRSQHPEAGNPVADRTTIRISLSTP